MGTKLTLAKSGGDMSHPQITPVKETLIQVKSQFTKNILSGVLKDVNVQLFEFSRETGLMEGVHINRFLI